MLNLKQSGQDYNYLYDGKGNVMAVIDSNQQVVAYYRYDVFGVPMKKVGTFDQPFRFSTKRYDEKTGLSHYGYRFYNPITGRWMTRDPLGEAGGINLYGFVQNNPVNFYDPLGLWYVDVNVSLGYVIGVTGGVLIGPEGIHPYVGGGVVTPPGGVAVTWSPHDPSTDWNIGLQGGFWGGGQVGNAFGNDGSWFWEVGFVTPGASLTEYYVFEPWTWNRDDDGCN